MKKFTDLLDEYLEADKEYKDRLANFEGDDLEYLNHFVVDRLRKATDELNAAFEKLQGKSK